MTEEELFPWGNFEDYWLGTPYDNTFLRDDVGWSSAEAILREIGKRELLQWTPDRDMYYKITRNLPNAIDRAGGTVGASPEFTYVKGRLVARGHLALELERQLNS